MRPSLAMISRQTANLVLYVAQPLALGLPIYLMMYVWLRVGLPWWEAPATHGAILLIWACYNVAFDKWDDYELGISLLIASVLLAMVVPGLVHARHLSREVERMRNAPAAVPTR